MKWFTIGLSVMMALLFSLQSCKHSTEPQLLLPDTTSHAFVWTAEFLGDGNGSHIYDVAILSESLAIAVGEMYFKDSLGRINSDLYNAGVWNGRTWTSDRVPYYFQAKPYYSQSRSIFGFGADDLWFGIGNLVHWDGSKYVTVEIAGFQSYANKIWGSLPNDLYVIGSSGLMYRFDGSAWQQVGTGTAGELLDIYGPSGGGVAFACGFRSSSLGTYLLRGSGPAWDVAYDGTPLEFSIREDSISGALASVYTPNSNQVFIASSAGVYEASTQTTGRGKRISFTDSWLPGFPFRIRGNAANDWFVVGEYSFVAHYNGATLYPYTVLMNNSYRLYSVAQRGNLVIAVGELKDPINSRGLILTGRR